MMFRIVRAAGVAAAILVAAPAALAQTPADIMTTMMDRYRDQVSGIDNYRVTQQVMGFEDTTTMEKTMVDGFPVFRPVATEGEAQMDVESPYSMMPKLADRGTLEGTETVDGEETWALSFDVEGLDLETMEPGGAGDFDMKSLRFWVDTDDYLIRKMHMEGEVVDEGTARPIDMTALLTDYRQVDGMWHPFRMEMTARGLMGAAGNGMSEEEMAETRAQLQQMQQQLESMPEAQREQIEKMMGPQMEQLESMLQSGEFNATVVVESLETNVDLSS